MPTLTEAQLEFIEECNSEFSDRYTDAEEDYKKVFDRGVPSPPIVCPWYTKSRFNNRDRGGAGKHDEHRQHYRNRDDSSGYDRNRHRYNRRDRPY